MMSIIQIVYTSMEEILTTSHRTTDKNNKKDGKHVRYAAGKYWEDKTLEDWEENDFRLFAGDLGNVSNAKMSGSGRLPGLSCIF